MANGAEVDDLFEGFGDTAVVDEALRHPKDALNDGQKQGLQRLHAHFIGKGSRSNGGAKGGDRRARGPFSRILAMKTITIPQEYAEYISEHGTDAAPFLHRKAIQYESGYWSGEQAGDAFIACYEYTTILNAEMDKDQVRWLFHMLLFFDIVQLIRPGSRGRRMGLMMLEEIQRFIQPLVGPTWPVEIGHVSRNVQSWCMCGSKAAILTSKFGPGCFFALGNHLSKDFLQNRITDSGSYHEEAMEHLKRLQLSEELRSERLDELGSNVREHLLRPFKERATQQTPQGMPRRQ